MPTPKGGAKPSASKATGTRRAPARRAPKATDRSVVTGVSCAWVNCADGLVRQIDEGEKLPEVTPEELDRLEALGVFGEHPRVTRKRELDELVAAGLASVGMSEVERAAEEDAARKDTSAEDDSTGDDAGAEPLAPPILPEHAPAPSTHGAQPEPSGS